MTVHIRALYPWCEKTVYHNKPQGTSLVLQCLRVHLPVQGTRVRSLAGQLRSHMPYGNAAAQEPMCHDYWACTLWSPRATTKTKKKKAWLRNSSISAIKYSRKI